MSDVIIHGVPGSPYVRTPLLVCEEKGASYRLSPLAMGEGKTPAYLARHPFGRMPAMEHEGFRLYETQAIARYLDAVLPGEALTPADPKAAARMNQVIGIIDSYVMPSISSGIAFNRVIRPMFGMPVDEAQVLAALPLARTCIGALVEILDGQPFFAGGALSLADLHALGHLDFFLATAEGVEMMGGTPIEGWLARMNARPSAQKTTMPALRAALEAQPA